MSNELFESLKEMYKSFLMEKEKLEEKLSSSNNENDSQFIENLISLTDTRINSISSVIKVFGECDLSDDNTFNDINLNNNDAIEKDINIEDINRNLRVLDIQEKERQRIARDLHDSSLQNLAHLVHKIELSSLYIDKDPVKAKLELASVNMNLKNIIQDIRNTIFDLRPMTFDDLGLKESFERLIYTLKEDSNMDIDYSIEQINCSNSLILMTIYRIVEECINNAIKHSGGTKVVFKLKRDKKNNCSVIISDNGRSFDIEKVLSAQDRHFGLCILKERVELLSGNMEIISNIEEGTTIKILIPLFDEERK